jgi:UDPglucose 6-dehydrogenase
MYKKKINIITIILYLTLSINAHLDTKKTLTIAVLGTGYVGLVTGAGLAACGHSVICVDIDSRKIASLQNGIVPFFEPNLDTLVTDGIRNGNLLFTTQVENAVRQADVIFIAVGTPSAKDGSADLTALYAAVDSIKTCIDSYKMIVVKSTVPLHTNQHIEQLLIKYGVNQDLFDIVSNPEFLREGSAVYDFFNPDRIVVGVKNKVISSLFNRIYPFLPAQNIPFVVTDTNSAEMIKYASNAFLALKVSFVNEIARLCDVVGADVQQVTHGMGLDKRINHAFLKPGPGFGGYCFPKDSRELLYTASKYNVPLFTVAASLQTNEQQRTVAINKLKKVLGNDLSTKKIAVLGLAFKANTDDIRETPALEIIQQLQNEKATVSAYDPLAMNNMKMALPNISYCNDLYAAIHNADALLILTEWDEFKTIDFTKAAKLMHAKYIIDMRNIVDLQSCIDNGFICDAIGRSAYCSTLHL